MELAGTDYLAKFLALLDSWTKLANKPKALLTSYSNANANANSIRTNMNNVSKTIIFDCDGVLVDTKLKFKAWQASLKQHRVDYQLSQYKDQVGKSSKEIIKSIKVPSDLDRDEFIKNKNNPYKNLQKTQVETFAAGVNFLKELINLKRDASFKLGLASSASQDEILVNLNHCGVDTKAFDAIASGRVDLKHILAKFRSW